MHFSTILTISYKIILTLQKLHSIYEFQALKDNTFFRSGTYNAHGTFYLYLAPILHVFHSYIVHFTYTVRVMFQWAFHYFPWSLGQYHSCNLSQLPGSIQPIM